jgi:integrase
MRYLDADGRWKQRKAKGAANKDQARALLLEAEHRVARGLMGVPEPTAQELGRRSITLAELVRKFLGEVEGEAGYRPPRVKSLVKYRRDARSVFKVRVLPVLGKRPAASIAAADLDRLRDGLEARELAAASIVQTLALVSKLYNWARRSGLVDCANPVSGVDRPRPAQSLDYLNAREVGELLATAAAQARPGTASWRALALYPMVATAIYCGLRKGELSGLRWSDVDLDAGRLGVLRSYRLAPKSGKPRHVPINAALAPVLRAWRDLCPATSELLVFPVELKDPHGNTLDRLRMGRPDDNFGLDGLLAAARCHAPADGHPWHMLRHTFAAHAVMSGANLYSVQLLMGHATMGMTQRYAHLAPDFMAAEVARMTFPAPAAAGVTDIAEARRLRAVDDDG